MRTRLFPEEEERVASAAKGSFPPSGEKQAENGDAPLSTKTTCVFVEEDERQNELEASGQEADANGAREDENFSRRKMIAL